MSLIIEDPTGDDGPVGPKTGSCPWCDAADMMRRRRHRTAVPPEDVIEVLRLRERGVPYPEIAAKLGRSVNVVRNVAFRERHRGNGIPELATAYAVTEGDETP